MLDKTARGLLVMTMFSQLVGRWIEFNPECFYYDVRVKGKLKEITTDARRKSSLSNGEDNVLTSGELMDRTQSRMFLL